jgi:hypothetical protein
MLAFVLASSFVLQGPAAPPAPSAPPTPTAAPKPAAKAGKADRERLVIVDDRAVKDQAPAPFLDRVVVEIGKRKGLRVERLSAARERLQDKEDQALAACGDEAGCLATAARLVGADAVVLVRMTRRDGEEARFVATTRINALRPQIQEDAGGIAGSEKDALPLVVEQVADVFPETELRPEFR